MNKIYTSLEIGLAVGFILGFFLSAQQLLWGQYLILSFGMALALLYVYFAFNSLQTRPTQTSPFITIFVYLICSIGIIALCLKLTLSPDIHFYYRMALYGFLGVILILLATLYLAQNLVIFGYYRSLLVRCLVIMAIGFMFYITPYRKLVNLYYKDQPQIAQKLIQLLEPPKPKPKKEMKQEIKK
jgi:uncharacterized protein YneF (UPF0154 family)